MLTKAGDCGNLRSFRSFSTFFLTERLLGGRREFGSTFFYVTNCVVLKCDSVMLFYAPLWSFERMSWSRFAEPTLSKKKPADVLPAYWVLTIYVRLSSSLSFLKGDRFSVYAVWLGIRCPLEPSSKSKSLKFVPVNWYGAGWIESDRNNESYMVIEGVAL